jgi:uncharacterized lipoprotein YmbA
MRIYRLSLAALCMVVLALAGCSKGGNNGSNAQLRVVNALSEAPALNVTVASTAAASALPFQGLTTYVSVGRRSLP